MAVIAVLIICIICAVLLRSLRQAYFAVPAHELKRRSVRANSGFKKLQLVAKYGQLAKILLDGFCFIFAAAVVIIISRAVDPLLALLLLGAFTVLVIYVPSRNYGFIKKIAVWAAPYLGSLLSYLEPLTFITSKMTTGSRSGASELYEKEDLEALLKRQKTAHNNRIDQTEIDSLIKVLSFSDKKINDHMVKREDIHFVTIKEPIGPILLSELHKSGFSQFPVKGNSDIEVVGMLSINHLADHIEGGVVADVMGEEVFYVREDKPLVQVLRAFVKTGSSIFMVINTQEEVIGLITVNDILIQLLGQAVQTDFNQYGDKSAVAHVTE